MDEKRKFSRVKKEVKIEVRDSESMTLSTTRDISNGGIFISTPEPVKVGSELEMSIQRPGSDSIAFKGVVRWIREDGSDGRKAGMGIEFTGLSQDLLNALKDLS